MLAFDRITALFEENEGRSRLIRLPQPTLVKNADESSGPHERTPGHEFTPRS